MPKLIPHLSHDDDNVFTIRLINSFLLGAFFINEESIPFILQNCLTHEEPKQVLNDFHSSACGGHLSGMATAQKIIRAGGYFLSSLFRDYIEAVKHCTSWQRFSPMLSLTSGFQNSWCLTIYALTALKEVWAGKSLNPSSMAISSFPS